MSGRSNDLPDKHLRDALMSCYIDSAEIVHRGIKEQIALREELQKERDLNAELKRLLDECSKKIKHIESHDVRDNLKG